MRKVVGQPSPETPAFVEKPLTRARVQEIRLRVQAAHAWSLREAAKFIGVDHAHLIRVEQGKRPITDKFREKFKALEREAARLRGRSRRERVEVTLISEFPLPARLEILAKPVRCRRCGRWIVPRQVNQLQHARGTCGRRGAGRRTRSDARRRK